MYFTYSIIAELTGWEAGLKKHIHSWNSPPADKDHRKYDYVSWVQHAEKALRLRAFYYPCLRSCLLALLKILHHALPIAKIVGTQDAANSSFGY